MGRWIGVDLDGTLAQFDSWQGPEHIGEPIPAMMERVRQWLDLGMQVKIFTARASKPECIPPIKTWLKAHGLGDLEVTNVKDFDMLELWDDRAVQVIPNTGKVHVATNDQRLAGVDILLMDAEEAAPNLDALDLDGSLDVPERLLESG